MSKLAPIFLNRDRRLQNGWWIAAFFALLAALLFPAILLSAQFDHQISIWEQLGLIAVATVAIQALRRRPLTEVTGKPGPAMLVQLAQGLGLGFILMAVPAAILWAAGWVRFDVNGFDPAVIGSGLALMAGVALAEELLFRGVLFQRMVDGVGRWPAQVIIGGLFVLTHMGNPGMEGAVRLLAGANIFLASILFGETFLRTRGLAMPVGLHFMANVTQGVILGFGVSGNAEPGWLTPEFRIEADWLTGGAFGLEASAVGIVTLALMLVAFVARNGLRRAAVKSPD